MPQHERRDSKPVYRQIAEQIKDDIATGTLVAGQLIPSESELVERYCVSRTSVRWAVAILRDEGLIYTVRAEGSYVCPKAAPKVRPAYKCEQIAADIIGQISTGRLKPGDRLPSEFRLTARYGVARDTIRAAIALLREGGRVYTRSGTGTFVTPTSRQARNVPAPQGGGQRRVVRHSWTRSQAR
ncbi:GntR family transcriptional regulator [Sinosporangium album]|uniref:GntR family transcriptional regulator n=1 Tax=Sinosporangium album TaxID=504805 RepID=UPI0015A4D3F6|nr:GntR family transcriptional regulator [Sinosporangium album]